jgi:hypothetical protein
LPLAKLRELLTQEKPESGPSATFRVPSVDSDTVLPH